MPSFSSLASQALATVARSRFRGFAERALRALWRERTAGAVAVLVAISATIVGVSGGVGPLVALLAALAAAIVLQTYVHIRRERSAATGTRVLAALETERLDAVDRHAALLAAIERNTAAIEALRATLAEIGQPPRKQPTTRPVTRPRGVAEPTRKTRTT
jgi:hypothetical protein